MFVCVHVRMRTNLSGQLTHPRSLHTLRIPLLLPLKRMEEIQKEKLIRNIFSMKKSLNFLHEEQGRGKTMTNSTGLQVKMV